MSAEPGQSRADEPLARLLRDLADATEREHAAIQVLQAIGRSTSELEPVFETVLAQAVRLCNADAGLIYLLDGEVYRMAFALGGSQAYRDYVEQVPIGRGKGTLVGRVGLTRHTVQIRDVLEDPDYDLHRARTLGGFRSMLGVPMLAEEAVVGIIILWRDEVDPFDEPTVDLVTTFAAQGAIAIQNVQLFQALRRRERDLARSVAELHALGETSRAVSSTLDLHGVLTTIVTRAVQLSQTDGGSIFEFDSEASRFRLRTCYGTSDDLAAALKAAEIGLEGTLLGRTATAGEVCQAPDLEAEPHDPHVDALLQAGWRSMLAVPLRREREIIGVLVVRRKVTGAFSEETAELMETLANQSAIAIHHAHLFRELEQQSRQLEEAGYHKSEFLAWMSHELRTPLNAVIGFSEVLLEQMFGTLNERQLGYVREILDSGRHLLELINPVLDLSKVEAGRLELELTAVSLPQVLEQGLAMVRERATKQGVSLSLDVPDEVGVIRGDELRLKQVVLNLLSNAVTFTPAGGSVDLAAVITGEHVQVSVRDTGIGIAAEEQARIFASYQRGAGASRASPEGTGLGLTLSTRLVALHGGELWLESTPGEGSTFHFSVPVRGPDSQPLADGRAPAPEVQGGAGAQAPVLVVEDDRHSAQLLALYLEGAGYPVALARDGAEGLELARRLRPRAILLDVVLPGVDGWALLAQLKSDPLTASCPVVIVSMLDERGKGLALGAADYLVKPVSRGHVLATLAGHAPSGGGPVGDPSEGGAVDR